jgi:hypothetical protein
MSLAHTYINKGLEYFYAPPSSNAHTSFYSQPRVSNPTNATVVGAMGTGIGAAFTVDVPVAAVGVVEEPLFPDSEPAPVPVPLLVEVADASVAEDWEAAVEAVPASVAEDKEPTADFAAAGS